MMPLRISSVLFMLIFMAGSVGAQWVEFNDETGTRLVLTSVNYPDTEEKDIAVGDLNNDGWTDIVISRKLPFSNPGAEADILLMNQNGVLVDQTATHAPDFIGVPTDARDLIVADFDGDGWKGVLFANTFQQQPVYHENLGADSAGNWLGLLEASASHLPIVNVPDLQICAAWAGDVTGNGALDVYMSNYVEFGGPALDVLLINDGNGVFTDESAARLGNLRNSAFGTSVEIADMDGDGDQDIVKMTTLYTVPPFNDLGTYVLFNDGTGNFTVYDDVPSAEPYMHHLADLNDDSQMDVYVVDDFQDYVNLSETIVVDTEITFDRTTLANSPGTTGFGGNVKSTDIDGDGDLDIGVADVDVDVPPCNSSRRFRLLENEGLYSGTISDPNSGVNEDWNLNTFDFQFIDINNDGKMDIFMGGCDWYTVWVQEGGGIACADISNVQSKCFADGRIGAKITATSTAHDGETIEFRINGNEVVQASFDGQIAKAKSVSIYGAGSHTVELVNPAGCWPSINVTCASGVLEADGWEESAVAEERAVVNEIALLGNYPNPFNPSTTIRYSLNEDVHVTLKIYNSLGQEVVSLVQGFQSSGIQEVHWDGRNNNGQLVTSGLYIYRLNAGNFILSQQMLLSK